MMAIQSSTYKFQVQAHVQLSSLKVKDQVADVVKLLIVVIGLAENNEIYIHHLYSLALYGVTPSECSKDVFSTGKTKMIGLPYTSMMIY